MAELMFWLADNVAVWRPIAIVFLALVAVGGLLFWLSVWESER